MTSAQPAGRRGEPPPTPTPLAVPTWDSHCHLDITEVPVPAALARARAAGIERIVQIGTDLASSRWSAEQAQRHDDLDAAVALHPNEAGAGRAEDDALAEIDRLAALPWVRAVGETGLDHFRTAPEGRAAQEASFRAHIEIAKRHDRALVIHDRDAHADVLRVLADAGAPPHTVFHCFSGDAALARECVARGYVLSFAGTVTFKNADGLRAAAREVPAGQLLVETDAPFLTPMPYRGRPNASYLVPLTVRALAEVRGEDVDTLCAAITACARRVFG